MSHAQTSTHCRVARNIQLRRNALHGVRIVSIYLTSLDEFSNSLNEHAYAHKFSSQNKINTMRSKSIC